MEALFLHLTDIHIKGEDDFNVLIKRNKALCKAMLVHVTNENETIIFICITGDITYEGSSEQYAYAELWLDDLIERIKTRYLSIRIQVVAVPGNHDCDFSDEFAPARDLLINNIDVAAINKKEIISSYTRIQKNYFDFIEKYNCKEEGFGCNEDRIITVNEYKVDNEPVRFKFHCVNSAWCSSINETKGKMHFISEEQFEKEDQDLIITLVHHDESWFDWDDVERWKKYYKTYSDIVFVGHDHVFEYVHKENYDLKSNYIIKGNQLCDPGNTEQSGFNILKIDLINNVQSFITYMWSGNLYEAIIATKGMPFSKNRYYSSTNRLKDSMNEFLEELDIDIYSSNKKNLSLSDVYVYPVLRGEHIQNSKRTVQYKNRDEIKRVIDLKKNILILGQKESGKTAFLKRLYKLYLDNNIMPVWIDASEFNSSDIEQLNELVKLSYYKQYDNINVEEVLQDDPANKACFVEDFDELSVSDESAKKILQYIIDRFGIIIISTTPAKYMIKTLRNLGTNEFIDKHFYKLEICDVRSYWKRKLVTKWMKLEEPFKEGEEVQFDLQRKERIQQINNVMKNGYFRQTPIEVLLVLSYLDNATRVSSDYSKYSYIYDCLIKDKLNDISQSKTDDAAMYQTILEQLAFKMYSLGERDFIDESFLISVIYDYNQEYTGARGEVIETINLFIKHNILTKTQDNKYKFKYDYMLYYFNCSFIKSQLGYHERCKVTRELIENITDDMNYNTLLFLAFGAGTEHDILPVVVECEKTLLKEYDGHKYDDFLKTMGELDRSIRQKVDEIFKVPFNKNIEELQERAAIISDRIREEMDSEEAKLKDTRIDDDIKEIIHIMRLAEMLSEMIKNYAGRLKREPRLEIIKEIHIMVMKTLGKMISMFDLVHGKLLKLTEDDEEEDKDKPLIKTVFANKLREHLYKLFKAYIKANIYFTAAMYNNDRIAKEVLDYNNELDSDFFKMVTIQYLINTGKGVLPINEIRQCVKGKNKISGFSLQVLKEIIAEDLYSYQFEARSKQAVCALFGFNIREFRIDWNNNMKIIEDE